MWQFGARRRAPRVAPLLWKYSRWSMKCQLFVAIVNTRSSHLMFLPALRASVRARGVHVGDLGLSFEPLRPTMSMNTRMMNRRNPRDRLRLASPLTTLSARPLTPFPSLLSRRALSTPPAQARLGRITPRRIAVPIMDGASGNGMPEKSIWRPIVFCLGLSLAGFTFAAWYTNYDTAQWLRRLGAGRMWGMGRTPSDRDIARARQIERAKRAQEVLNTIPRTLGFLPNFILVPIVRLFVTVEEWRLNTPPAHTAPAAIIVAMGVVFAAWRVQAWAPFMRKWFLHRPVLLGGGPRREWANCVTLFTSTLSHMDIWHFAFNSIALYSFGSAAYAYLAAPDPGIPRLTTSTNTPHFYAFLLAAGLFASLGSHLFTNVIRLPRLIRTLLSPARLSSAQALAAHQAILPSLGASGAIYAAVTMTALAYPDSDVSIIFLPFITIPTGLGVAAMVCVDIVGILRGWRTFDHVAHFCGALFGVVYYQYGKQFYNWLRRQLGAHQQKSARY